MVQSECVILVRREDAEQRAMSAGVCCHESLIRRGVIERVTREAGERERQATVGEERDNVVAVRAHD